MGAGPEFRTKYRRPALQPVALPFTGLDLALLLAGGLILLVLGMFLRRAAKRTT